MFKIFKSPKYTLLVILLLTLFAIFVDLPKMHLKFNVGKIAVDNEIGAYELNFLNGLFYRDLKIKQGLDIAGGVSVVLKADMSKIPDTERKDALNSLKDVIEKRVNLLGISEANVQTSVYKDEYRVLVDLAGVFDTSKALEAIGKVAKLEFKLQDDSKPSVEDSKNNGQDKVNKENPTNLNIPKFKETGLTGADLKKASVTYTQGQVASEPAVSLLFNADGTKKFRDITANNVGKLLAVYLDDDVIIQPVIKVPITDGNAVISGNMDIDTAKVLAAQLNAGALPVPVNIIEQKTVGPSLGKEAVIKNVYAGLLGLVLVIIFMIVMYGRLGFLASLALIIYGLFTLALYKLIPVVLTLPGLAGFILSIGMAVDSNILIFERVKEELRLKKPLSIALENGFGRSWDSIRDANVATLTTAFILFNPFDFYFFPSSGLVRGFALTLALGIIMSLFTGVFITRNLVRVFYRIKEKKL